MDDNKRNLGIVAICALVIIILIISQTLFYAHKDRMIVQAISRGVDPVGASIALTDPYESESTLYLLAKPQNSVKLTDSTQQK